MTFRIFRYLRFSFSLRSLLLATTLVAVLLGTWIARAERQRRAVARIASICNLHQVEHSFNFEVSWGFVDWIPTALTAEHWVHYWYKLDKLHLHSTDEISSDLLGAISELSEIREVGFASCSINSNTLSSLQSCHIQQLEFFNVRFFGGPIVRLPQTLRSLSLNDCSNCQPVFESLPNLSQLRSFDVDRIPFTDEQFILLHALPNLEHISIGLRSNCIITSRAMAGIDVLKKLKTLCIQSACAAFDDVGLEPISNLTQLENLSIPSCRVSSNGYKKLARCKRLTAISLYGCPEDESALQGLSEIKSLSSIEFHEWHKPVSEKILNHLVDLPNLETVDTDEYAFSLKGLKRLYQLPGFRGMNDRWSNKVQLNIKMIMGRNDAPWTEQALDLSGLIDLSDGLVRLQEATTLRNLNLDRTQLEDSDFAALGKLVGLESLHIEGVTTAEVGIRHLGALNNLNSLFARDVTCSWENLPNFERLTVLLISGEHLTEAGCAAIAKLPKLESLLILDGVITKEQMGGLLNSPTLTSLSLLDCKIKTDSLKNLANCKSLTHLDFSDSHFERNVGLEGLPNIQDLDLSGTNFTDADAACLDGFLHLTQLSLNRTQITDVALGYIKNLPALERLDIGYTNCTCTGIRSLVSLPLIDTIFCHGIELDESIASSSIFGVVINPDWDKAFASAAKPAMLPDLRVGSLNLNHSRIQSILDADCLSSLDLSHSNVSKESFTELLRYKKLAELSLADTAISDEAILPLKGYANLEELDLSGTEITDRGLSIVATLPALKTLNLGRTKITNEGLRQLKPLAKQIVNLGLKETSVDAKALEELSDFSNLRVLELAGTAISLEDCVGKISADHLEELSVQDAKLDLGGIDCVFRSSRSQTYLELNGPYWTDQRVQELIGNRYLQSITFENTNCAGATRELFSSLPFLQVVRWKDVSVDAEELSCLSNFRFMSELKLENTVIDQPHIDAIAGIRSLGIIRMTRTKIPSGLDWSSLVSLPVLEELVIDGEIDIDTKLMLNSLLGDRLRLGRF